jgi:hypothetical protein
MSEEFGEPAFRLNWRVLLPSVLALTLFVVLTGLIAAVAIGITANPPEAPEVAATTPSDPAPEAHAGRGEAEDVATSPPTEPEPAENTGGSHPAGADEATSETASTQTDEPVPAPPVMPTLEAAPATEPVTKTPTKTAAVPPLAPKVESPQPAVPQLPQLPVQTGRGLRPAPDLALIEQSSFGPLPKIGANGREPWQAYARPVESGDDRPRIAVILSGLGLSSAATEAAIQGLPGEVTLAFQPFADNIQQWIRLARAAGHEVLLNLPMEPVDFPANDPGPRALFITLSPDENEERLRWALSRVTGYVGVVNHMGSRFTTSRESMQPILAEIKARGLLYVDARSSARSIATVMASQMQVPHAINDRFLDSREVSRVTIDARLVELERIAKDASVSIAIGQAFPVTIERVREWAQTLEGKGLALVPVSAVVNTQADR